MPALVSAMDERAFESQEKAKRYLQFLPIIVPQEGELSGLQEPKEGEKEVRTNGSHLIPALVPDFTPEELAAAMRPSPRFSPMIRALADISAMVKDQEVNEEENLDIRPIISRLAGTFNFPRNLAHNGLMAGIKYSQSLLQKIDVAVSDVNRQIKVEEPREVEIDMCDDQDHPKRKVPCLKFLAISAFVKNNTIINPDDLPGELRAHVALLRLPGSFKKKFGDRLSQNHKKFITTGKITKKAINEYYKELKKYNYNPLFVTLEYHDNAGLIALLDEPKLDVNARDQ
jgi:hypothetical protein